MENTKITRSMALATVIEGREVTPEVIEVLKNLKASIDKKSSDNSKAKAQAKASRDVIADAVFDFFTAHENKPMTITDLINKGNLGDVSTSKVTSALRLDGRFASEKSGRSSLYRIAE